MTKIELIEKITPLYNKYKKEGAEISATEALIIMWEIGDALSDYIREHSIAPHNLYRDIYGKSEGLTNKEQKSYITREFQGRCYRIRQIFSSKEIIKTELPNLKSFTTFREAMPFFDNKKYRLIGEDKNNLLSLLNSNLSSADILKNIKVLQKNKIGIKNPRTQRLSDLNREKNIFVNFYNYIFRIIKVNDYKEVENLLAGVPTDLIINLSKDLTALTQEGLRTYNISLEKLNNQDWVDFVVMIIDLLSQKTPKKIRRIRRIIPVQRFARLAEMLFALTSREAFLNFH